MFVIYDEKPACGFLNRKTVVELNGKKSKDRTWYTFWCQVKEGKLEFHRVQGMNPKAHGDPPPKDIYPPPNRQQTKAGFVELDNCWVEIDYTSQKDKDLDKRRKFLFRIVLPNKMEYLFQAPSETQMLQWVTHIKKAAFNDEDLEGPDLSGADVRIKASRCSINKKSKHNTNSVRVSVKTGLEIEDDIESTSPTLIQLDPRLALLKQRIQYKRELGRQLQKMLSSFSGDPECLYRESESSGSRQSSRLPSSVSGENVAVTDGIQHCSVSSDFFTDGARAATTLLMDYYLIPGVDWSLLKKGDTVEVLGRLPNGWYKCRATKDALLQLDALPSTSEDQSSGTEVASTPDDTEGQPKRRNPYINLDDLLSHTSPEMAAVRKELKGDNGTEYDSNGVEHEVNETEENDTVCSLSESDPIINPIPRLRTESYLNATTDNPVVSPPVNRLWRKDSYKEATNIDSLSLNKTRHLSLIGNAGMLIHQSNDADDDLKRLRIKTLIDHEQVNNKYNFPLVGSIPPSVLRHFTKEAIGNRPPSTTSDYGSSAPAADDSPRNSSHTKISSPEVGPGIAIPSRGDKVEGEDVAGSIIVGSIPSKMMNSSLGVDIDERTPEYNKKERSASLPVAPLDIDATTTAAQNIPETQHKDDKESDEDNLKIFEFSSSYRSIVSPSPVSPSPSPVSPLPSPKPSPKPPRQNKPDSNDDLHKSVLNRFKKIGKKKKEKATATGSLIEEEEQFRSRMTSISGKTVRAAGMSVKIGDDTSSESESEEPAEKSHETITEQELSSSFESTLSQTTPDETNNGAMPALAETHNRTMPMKVHSSSIDVHVPATKAASTPPSLHRFMSEGGIHNSIPRADSLSFSPTRSITDSKVGCFLKVPKKGLKRHIKLDPSQKKFGFHLETYEFVIGQGRVQQTIVQHVAPASQAFVSGMFPGDHVLKINDVDVSESHTSTVVKEIVRGMNSNRLEIVVMFVDGANRLALKTTGDEYKHQLKDTQGRLEDILSRENKDITSAELLSPLSPTAPLLGTADGLADAINLPPWKDEEPCADDDDDDENTLDICSYSPHLNSIVALYNDEITELKCDLLVMPVAGRRNKIVGDVLEAGGYGLFDDLCLSDQCLLGGNIITNGHNLKVQCICHSVFGHLKECEDVVSCVRNALEHGYEQEFKSVVFWVEGFISTGVPPYVIISAVREWLQERDNAAAYHKVVFSMPASPANSSLMERYFPLEDNRQDQILQELKYCTDDDEYDESEGNTQQTGTITNRTKMEKIASPTLSEVDAMFDDISIQVAALTESIEQ